MEKAQIRIIRSKRKTVALEIRPDLSVLVRAPYWMADWQIRKFVDEKSDWLYAHLRENQNLHIFPSRKNRFNAVTHIIL